MNQLDQKIDNVIRNSMNTEQTSLNGIMDFVRLKDEIRLLVESEKDRLVAEQKAARREDGSIFEI